MSLDAVEPCKDVGRELEGMMMTTGTVVNGKIVVEGEPLTEGAIVTILTPEDGFKPSPEEKAALLESIQEADAGDVISGEAVLRELGVD